MEIAVFPGTERPGLTCAWITRTVNRLSHVRSAPGLGNPCPTCLPLIEHSIPQRPGVPVSKRTFQPNNRRRAKVHGFRERMRTRAGRAVLAARRRKGREQISASLMFVAGPTGAARARQAGLACWRGRAAAAVADEEPGRVQAHDALGPAGRRRDPVRTPVADRRCGTRGHQAEGRLGSQPCGWLGGGSQPGKATAPGTDARARCRASRGQLARVACTSGSRWRTPGGSSRRS